MRKEIQILEICTFMSTNENETFFSGTDDEGNEATVVFNTIDLLKWVDVDWMKLKSKEYIAKL